MNANAPCAFPFIVLHCSVSHRSSMRGSSNAKVACSVHGICFQGRGGSFACCWQTCTVKPLHLQQNNQLVSTSLWSWRELDVVFSRSEG